MRRRPSGRAARTARAGPPHLKQRVRAERVVLLGAEHKQDCGAPRATAGAASEPRAWPPAGGSGAGGGGVPPTRRPDGRPSRKAGKGVREVGWAEASSGRRCVCVGVIAAVYVVSARRVVPTCHDRITETDIPGAR